MSKLLSIDAEEPDGRTPVMFALVLYLVRPNSALVWNDLEWKLALAAAGQGGDLSRLDWSSDTDQALDAFKMRVALRHGVACSTGIVVEGLTLRAGGAGDDLRALSIAADDSRQAVKSNDDLTERLMPGWKAYGEDLDVRVAASSEAEAQRRDSKAADLLASEPKAELVKHWRQLGGDIPSPV